MNNIILCGFMGCGKTTVGKRIASRTGRCFVDMDAYIVEQAGLSVTEIFDRFGEADFRRGSGRPAGSWRVGAAASSPPAGSADLSGKHGGAGDGGAHRAAGCGVSGTAAAAGGGRQPPAAGGTGPGAQILGAVPGAFASLQGSRLRNRAGGPGVSPSAAADKVLTALGNGRHRTTGAERRPSLCGEIRPDPSKKNG